jgi:hypothetical protein
MYALEQLQHKSLKELKEIGWQLNVLPVSDRRCRQSWIDALVNVNPPLLQLLEASPAASVEQVQPIIETVEAPSAVEVEPVQTLPIELKFGRVVYPRPAQKSIEHAVETSPGVGVDPFQEAIAPAAENFPGVECFIESNRNNFSGVERVTESNRNNFSGVERFTESNRNNFSGVERVTESNRNNFSGVERVQELIENSPGVEVDSVSKPIASAAENSPGVKTEAIVSESAIGLAAKNPILTGLTFSDRFLACYAPPQPEIIHFRSDADGQLSLLNFEIESVDEPPDPDDFESLDAFREAISRWDWEHNEVSPEHNEVSPEHNEPLQVSLESFCLWRLCSADWYEPAALLQLSQTCKSFITSDFFIPTFYCLSDRPNRSDESPDTGIFAKLPKPKPLSFPPATVGQAQSKPQPTAAQPQAKRKLNAYQTHTCCILAGSSTQPARAPPGGDAGF